MFKNPSPSQSSHSQKRQRSNSADLFTTFAALLFTITTLVGATGCGVENLIGGMMASEERNKIVDIDARYLGLNDQRIAVLVDAPMDIQYEYPGAVPVLTEYVSLLIAGNCLDSKVIPTRHILAYLNQNVYWPMMDYNQLAAELGVDRIVMVDLIEYRLFEIGNSYYWDGQIIADINIFEAGAVDSTEFGFSNRIRSRYPDVEMVARQQIGQAQVEAGLQGTFARDAVWMFYDHQRINADIIDQARRNN